LSGETIQTARSGRYRLSLVGLDYRCR